MSDEKHVEAAWAKAVEKAAEDAEYVFRDSCSHAAQAIDYMKQTMLAAAPQASQPIGQPVTCKCANSGACDGSCAPYIGQPVSGAGMTDEQRDKWKLVDGDCREEANGLITYHVAAFDEGYKAGLSASGQAVSEREAEIDRLAWNEALSAAARYVNGRLAGRAEGSELWLELGKIEQGIRTLSSTPAQQTEAPVNVPSGWIEQCMEAAHEWAHAAYCKALGKSGPDIDASKKKLRNLLAAPAPVQTEAQQSEKDAELPAVMLTRATSGMCEVSLEVGGKWVTVIRDNGDIISHIVEPRGISRAIAKEKAKS